MVQNGLKLYEIVQNGNFLLGSYLSKWRAWWVLAKALGRRCLPRFKLLAKFPIDLHIILQILIKKRETLLHAVSGSWKLPLPVPATMVAKNQCLTCCLTCCFWCWISHWVLLILSWNMWLRGRSGGLWLGRDPGGVGGSVKIGDWVFDLVGIFPWLRSFGLTFRLLVLGEYSYLGVYLSAVTIWSMPFVLVSCC